MYSYEFERRGVIFLIDTKSFYASVEAVEHGYHPLQVPLVVVSEGANVGGGGLILATSPKAKQLYGIKTNVSRMKDISHLKGLIKKPPRMNLYIQYNLRINEIYKRFTAEEDIHPYSIDESILDMTHTWRLFGSTPAEVARAIQLAVHQETGLYTTVGIGDNPTQAKIALDIYAKKAHSLIGEIHAETVPDLIWNIDKLDDVWSIGSKTAVKLEALGIHSMRDLAHYNPFKLREKFGANNGLRLYALAWGVDRAKVSETVQAKSKSLGNSQVLPRDYTKRREVEIVLRELAEQVATRVRHQKYLAGSISVYVGNAYGGTGFKKTVKLKTPTAVTRDVQTEVVAILAQHWQPGTVRNVALYLGDLVPDNAEQLDLFQDVTTHERQQKLDKAVDALRSRFGFTKLVNQSSMLDGGTAIGRAGLVGGHNGGNARE